MTLTPPRLPRRALLGAALAAPLIGRAAQAQGSWSPDRPIRLVVPFAPGGSQDVMGRLLAQGVSQTIGQQVVVENRAGAGGLLGAEAVANAAPDGTTLLLATAGQLTIAKAVGRKLSYDPINSFTPVIHLVDSPVVLLAAPQLGIDTLPALLERAKKPGDPLTYASTGIGTNTHLIMEELKAKMGLNVEHVPYRGAAAAFNDLLAGRISLMFISAPSVLSFSGNALKVVAITSPQRFAPLPNVPTMSEGGVPGFEASIWTGISAPARTPAPIVARLQAEFAKALKSELVTSRLDTLGAIVNGAEGPAFGQMLKDDLARWTAVAAPLNIELE